MIFHDETFVFGSAVKINITENSWIINEYTASANANYHPAIPASCEKVELAGGGGGG